MHENRHLPTTHGLHGGRIAIFCAGLGSPTLGRLPQHGRALVTVFERDTVPAVRRQGGSLDLHEGRWTAGPPCGRSD